MRIYLDSTVARWLRQAFNRPYSFDDVQDGHQWGLISARLKTDSHGPYIDTAKADSALLEWFMRHLILKGWGKTYGKAFRRIATQLAEHMGASIVDRLADLIRAQEGGPPPKPIGLGHQDSRTRALNKITKRKRGPE